MHYYQFNIGDYAKATRHLSNLEDLAYRRLMEIYYDTEKPLVNDVDKLARLINMRENKAEIEVVLSDFFTLSDDGFSQKRIDEEIQNYNAKAYIARVNGKKGGRPKKANGNPEEIEQEPKKTQSVILANPEKTGSKANQKPITNNQEPITNNQLDKSDLPAKASAIKQKDDLSYEPFFVLGMDQVQIDEVNQIRKDNKGGKITQRVINTLAKEFCEAQALGLTNEGILNEWSLRGWKSFKAEWTQQAKSGQGWGAQKGKLIEGGAYSQKTAQTIDILNSWTPPED
jgi:uncharacterized protein YdaU (DUF1376 family)